jgi:hypothetical protein
MGAIPIPFQSASHGGRLDQTLSTTIRAYRRHRVLQISLVRVTCVPFDLWSPFGLMAQKKKSGKPGGGNTVRAAERADKRWEKKRTIHIKYNDWILRHMLQRCLPVDRTNRSWEKTIFPGLCVHTTAACSLAVGQHAAAVAGAGSNLSRGGLSTHIVFIIRSRGSGQKRTSLHKANSS